MQLDSFTLPGGRQLFDLRRKAGGWDRIAVKIFWINQAPADVRISPADLARTVSTLVCGANGRDVLPAIYDLDN